MPTLEKRITKLKTSAEACRKKAASLPAYLKLIAAAEAKETLAAKFETDNVKVKADASRKADNHAKITLGAGALLLPAKLRASVLGMILPLLAARHQKSLGEWFVENEIDFVNSVDMDGSDAAITPMNAALISELASHAIGQALQRTIDGMTEGELGLLIPDILGHANDVDRTVLDAWLAKRNSPNA